VPDRLWNDEPGLHAEADRLRREHSASSAGNGSHGPPGDDDLENLGEWDAGEDDAPIPPRGWLLGNIFCRCFLSSLIGDGGVGKTALRIAQMLALATGRPLTGEHVFQRCRVLLISLEDDRDELRRRVRAAMLHYGIALADVKGWLFLAAPKRLKLIEKSVTGGEQTGKLEALLRAAISRHSLDAVCLDPFVKTHGLEENDNNARRSGVRGADQDRDRTGLCRRRTPPRQQGSGVAWRWRRKPRPWRKRLQGCRPPRLHTDDYVKRRAGAVRCQRGRSSPSGPA
jgi:hypothetical protein